MLLLIDNYDSFTYNLLDYFKQLGHECMLIRNDLKRAEWPLNPEAVVISPGPMDPSRAGNLMDMLAYYTSRVPILGICLGHQAIGMHFGAKLIHANRPMHGKISRIYCEKDKIFDGFPEQFNVVRYHSLVLDQLGEELISLAKTKEGEVMAIKHQTLPIFGIQYHPEAALTEFGIELLANWLDCCSIGKVN